MNHKDNLEDSRERERERERERGREREEKDREYHFFIMGRVLSRIPLVFNPLKLVEREKNK